MFDGDVYIGSFSDGRYHGHGTLKRQSGISYIGNFHLGKASGYGKEENTRTNSIFVGEFLGGYFHGKGTLVCGHKTYEGSWINGTLNGFGRCYDSDKRLSYIGQFDNNQIRGVGISVDISREIRIGHHVGYQLHGGDGVIKYMCCRISGPDYFRDDHASTGDTHMRGYTSYVAFMCFRFFCCLNSKQLVASFSDVFYPQYSDANFVLARLSPEVIASTVIQSTTRGPSICHRRISPQCSDLTFKSGMTGRSSTSTFHQTAVHKEAQIRFISFESLKNHGEFPRFPDCRNLTVDLDDIDRSNTLFVFLSHCWIAGYENSQHWRGYPHIDDKHDSKYKLVVEGIQRAWDMLAPGMTQCYVWIDFGCIDQDGDPAGELRQLMKIVQVSDFILTPIVDSNYEPGHTEAVSSILRTEGDWLKKYKADSWNVGPHSYLARSWCRMEMLYAANVPLMPGEGRIHNFAAGLKSAFLAGRRPHLLYGTRESCLKGPCLVLEPLQNSQFEEFNAAKGSITKDSDRQKIEMLMSQLTITKVVEEYRGEVDSEQLRDGTGCFIEVNGCRYDGQWKKGYRDGRGRQIFANGDMYEVLAL